MIGFKNTNNKVMVVDSKVKPHLPSVEDLIQMKGFQEAKNVVLEYFDASIYPLLRNEDRDAFFIKRLRKIKERYFDEI